MIDFIAGPLGDIAGDRITVQMGSELSCIHISVLVPRSQIAQLPLPPAHIRLATCLIWRDTGPMLFGFATRAQVALFQQLNEVASVGPKTALALIDKLGEEGLVRAVEGEDFTSLSQVAGVGKKTAQRIVIDLKGKCGTYSMQQMMDLPQTPPLQQQALNALVHLGYPAGQAKKLIDAALAIETYSDASQLIAKALRLGAH